MPASPHRRLPYQGTTADCVHVFADDVVAQVRDAVKKKLKDEDSTLLLHIASSQLGVYRNKGTCFDCRRRGAAAVGDGKEDPLEEDSPVADLGKSKKEALVMAVPSSVQRTSGTLTGASDIALAIKGLYALRSEKTTSFSKGRPRMTLAC
ncbi:hypothetical protein HDU96_008429 [Phlyctochytrium bullatum]|nr:hypothetical protein HDU96_008429 [Phlyctochytrium bullatum]